MILQVSIVSDDDLTGKRNMNREYFMTVEILEILHSRGAGHLSLTKGTSFRRAHEQSTTASPFLLIKR